MTSSITLGELIGWTIFAVFLILGSARLTRLLVADDFPPSVRARMWWDRVTHDGGWSKLVHCPWCAAPYIVALNLAAAWLSRSHPAWWVVNGWLAASYVASWIVFKDED
jgi:hypothetical protein